MPKFRVQLVTVASTHVEVEAEDGEAAIEAAFEQELPYAPAFADYEFGEWNTYSAMFPGPNSTPEDDWTEITE